MHAGLDSKAGTRWHAIGRYTQSEDTKTCSSLTRNASIPVHEACCPRDKIHTAHSSMRLHAGHIAVCNLTLGALSLCFFVLDFIRQKQIDGRMWMGNVLLGVRVYDGETLVSFVFAFEVMYLHG